MPLLYLLTLLAYVLGVGLTVDAHSAETKLNASVTFKALTKSQQEANAYVLKNCPNNWRWFHINNQTLKGCKR